MNLARPLCSGALLLALGTTVGVGAAESLLRFLGLARAPGLFTVSESEYRRIPGIFSPNQRLVLGKGTRFQHTVTIDSLGYRGEGFPRSKPTGEFRVLVVGDSFTWGHNVDDSETLPAHLERSLQTRCGDAVVVNAGLSGSSIIAHQAMAERGLVVDPDLVVLVYHENDIGELAYSRMWERLAANREAKSRFPVSLAYPLVRESALWNLAQEVRRGFEFRTLDESGADDAAFRPEGGDTESVERARAEYALRLADLSARLASQGVPLAVVTYPHPASVRLGIGGRDYAWVLETATELGLPILDLLEPLRSAPLPLEEIFLLPGDYHPSSAGHALAADRLAGFLAGTRPGTSCTA